MKDTHRIGKGGSKVKGKRASGILFTDGRSMLLLKRAGEGDFIGSWALPGGKNKGEETDIGAAIREVREETGLKDIPGYRFDTLASHNGRQKFTAFLFRVPAPFDVHLSHEHSEYKWVPFADLDRMTLHPKFEEHLPEYLHMIRKRVRTFSEWVTISDIVKLLTECDK